VSKQAHHHEFYKDNIQYNIPSAHHCFGLLRENEGTIQNKSSSDGGYTLLYFFKESIYTAADSTIDHYLSACFFFEKRSRGLRACCELLAASIICLLVNTPIPWRGT
jgi:hypothetical protein